MVSINSVNKAGIGFSQLPDDVIFEYNNVYGAHHYSRQKLVVRKAEGIWLYSLDDKKYLDCLAAYSAANQGHCHPKIVQALVEAMQGGYASVISNVVYTDSYGLLQKKVAERAPQLGLRFG